MSPNAGRPDPELTDRETLAARRCQSKSDHFSDPPARRAGEIVPHLIVPAGDCEYHEFRRDRLASLQSQYGIQALTDDNMRDLFLRFVADGDMSSSDKPVLLTGILRCADRAGRVRVQDLLSFFRDANRATDGQVVEAPKIRMSRVAELSDLEIERTMLAMPFEKSERKGFFRRQKDLAFVRFTESLWRRLTDGDKQDLLNDAAT